MFADATQIEQTTTSEQNKRLQLEKRELLDRNATNQAELLKFKNESTKYAVILISSMLILGYAVY